MQKQVATYPPEDQHKLHYYVDESDIFVSLSATSSSFAVQ